jgi:cell division septation protein DedD
LEQQAKERFTGGVILVVLLVLLVPELLTGPRAAPPATPAQPDQAPMRSYTMDLGESPRANSAPVAASTIAPGASEPITRASPAAQSARMASATVAAPPPAAAPRADATPRPAASVRPPAAPPRAAVMIPVPGHATQHSAAAWTVQLGTFTSRENAAHLLARLKSHGFAASVVESSKNGHKLFRVRVGNERDRAAAQKLLGHLKAAGEKGGTIVPR